MITLADKIRCIKRELAMRRSAYPRFIAATRMKQEAADREIAVMSAVLADLERARDMVAWEPPPLEEAPNPQREDGSDA